jgi:outer membrane protein OmpA-like peptidoglycan-associated protein
MKTSIGLTLGLLLAMAWMPAHAEPDLEGCKDHPLFNRMPGYRLWRCDTSEFDAAKFYYGPGTTGAKTETVEGAITRLGYEKREGVASHLQIARNYQNAIKAAGGEVMGGDNPDYVPIMGFQGNDINGHHGTVLRLSKGGKEIWTAVAPEGNGTNYTLLIAERQAMAQAIAANDLLASLSKVGFVAIYLNFDTGKAALQSDAASQLDQMAQLLKSNAGLKVEVGGHTDNVGDTAANQKLSDARAQTVMQELAKRGIAANRLTAKGYGQTVPVADNRLEEGRAKNRRVELVKK